MTAAFQPHFSIAWRRHGGHAPASAGAMHAVQPEQVCSRAGRQVLTSMGSVATGRTRGRSPRPAPRTLHQLPRALRLSIGVPSFTGFHPLREVSLRHTKHRVVETKFCCVRLSKYSYRLALAPQAGIHLTSFMYALDVATFGGRLSAGASRCIAADHETGRAEKDSRCSHNEAEADDAGGVERSRQLLHVRLLVKHGVVLVEPVPQHRLVGRRQERLPNCSST